VSIEERLEMRGTRARVEPRACKIRASARVEAEVGDEPGGSRNGTIAIVSRPSALITATTAKQVPRPIARPTRSSPRAQPSAMSGRAPRARTSRDSRRSDGRGPAAAGWSDEPDRSVSRRPEVRPGLQAPPGADAGSRSRVNPRVAKEAAEFRAKRPPTSDRRDRFQFPTRLRLTSPSPTRHS
jgi:hypothetical protein